MSVAGPNGGNCQKKYRTPMRTSTMKYSVRYGGGGKWCVRLQILTVVPRRDCEKCSKPTHERCFGEGRKSGGTRGRKANQLSRDPRSGGSKNRNEWAIERGVTGAREESQPVVRGKTKRGGGILQIYSRLGL